MPVVPTMRSILVCADVKQDDDGDYDIHGVFRQLIVEEFPVTAKFKVFAMMGGLEPRPYRVAVDIKGPAVSDVNADSVEMEALDEGFYDQVAVVPVEVTIQRAGDLYVEMRLDNETAGSFFVPVLARVAGPVEIRQRRQVASGRSGLAE